MNTEQPTTDDAETAGAEANEGVDDEAEGTHGDTEIGGDAGRTLPMSNIHVCFDGERRDVAPGSRLTFGRQGDLVIDSANRSMHRLLGQFWDHEGQWRLANLGRTVSIVVIDLEGASFAHVVPGADIPVPFRNTAVAFSAGRANYRLTVEQPMAPDNRGAPPFGYEMTSDATITATRLVFNAEQLELLRVFAELRADGPVRAADIPSNRQLAQRLGWTPTKLTRKLDNLCSKLDRAGVTGLVGDSADSATSRRVTLANVAVEQGLVDVRSTSPDPSAPDPTIPDDL